MERTNFEELQVYRLAEKLADLIWKSVQEWQPFDKQTVGKQLVRAADSIPANIADLRSIGGTTKNKIPSTKS